jgi:hypothetical protein
VTALPTLDPDADKVAYDVSDWNDGMLGQLQGLLEEEGIPFEFDQDGDVVTLADHEARIEELMDTIEFPDALPIDDGAPEAAASTRSGADGDDGAASDGDEDQDDDGEDGDDEGTDAGGIDAGDGGLEAADVLSELFVAADRLMHKARDHDGVLSLVASAEEAEQLRVPYGFSPASWRDIIAMVGEVRAALEDDDAKDEDIEERARDLRNTLREFV